MDQFTHTFLLSKNPLIRIETVPGHFATGCSHVNYYLNMSGMKSIVSMAKEVAKEMAIPYLTSHIVNTIVCMDGTEAIGAYLADELLKSGTAIMNINSEICITTPTYNVNRRLTFNHNTQKMIKDQNIILLVASVSSGQTIHNAIECIEYYGGELVGVSTLFSALESEHNHEIHSLFTANDIPGYSFYVTDECVLCKNGQKLDAIVNSEGYTKI